MEDDSRSRGALTPPYIPASGFERFLNLARQKSWPTVDSNTLQANGFSPSLSFYLISGLKFLGLITEDGKRTELLEEITASTSEEELSSILKKVVESAYHDLLETMVLSSTTINQIDGYFRRKGVAPTVATRSARFFIYLANRAGYEVGDTVELYKHRERVKPKQFRKNQPGLELQKRSAKGDLIDLLGASTADYEKALLKILMEKISLSSAIPDFETIKQMRDLIESIERKEQSENKGVNQNNSLQKR